MVRILSEREWKEGDEPFLGGRGVILTPNFGRFAKKPVDDSKQLSAKEHTKRDKEKTRCCWQRVKELYRKLRLDANDHEP